MRFAKYLKSYLTFSKSERNGILFLFVILVLILTINFISPQQKIHKNQTDFLKFQKSIDSLFVSDSFSMVKPSQTASSVSKVEHKTYERKVIPSLEINSADSSALEMLPGIGPVFANRIIKYRNLLGGYTHIEQLSEVYGLKPEFISKAVPYIKIDLNKVTKINLDSASFGTLAKHPYIGKEKAKLIFRNRYKMKYQHQSQHGFLYGTFFDSAQWQRVRPYITTE
jgi:competence protein ComEA